MRHAAVSRLGERGRPGRRRWPALAAVALACSSGSAGAHTGGSTGYASILVQRDVIRYSLSLTPSSLPPVVPVVPMLEVPCQPLRLHGRVLLAVGRAGCSALSARPHPRRR
jgi:hypothetical protein